MITYWSIILAVSMLIYVVLDGFDLGVGMLFGFTRDENKRRHMLASVSPIWDGNETWLIVAGVVLWGAFPPAYAALLSAFYLPVTVMLAGLIFRGVAFEFRVHAQRTRRIWDIGFVLGSLCAAFMQGAMVGALAQGLPVTNGRFLGNDMTWLSGFSALSGVALCAGYALLGAGWIARKCEGETREAALRLTPRLSVTVLILLAALFVHSLLSNLAVMQRWVDRPALLLVALVALCAIADVFVGVRRDSDTRPFRAIVLLFVCAYAMFAISFWPYMVPFAMTIAQAAAPMSSLKFMFWGAGLFIFPLMLIYTLCSYNVFKGKVDDSAGYD
ncbi:MAG TPA: cytochrome d ubiquinol oxidase subunit II [Acerihabitans sp.]